MQVTRTKSKYFHSIDVLTNEEVSDETLAKYGLNREQFSSVAGQYFREADFFKETITDDDGEVEEIDWVDHPSITLFTLPAVLTRMAVSK
ncbi:hypothetical protein KNT81_gp213 [Proteus phage phiP4-3]|uniref:Uncharacterized protein n=1 Tax=Proteus phage phiP4-3 TaxID=2065203 RepID=A0A2I6PFQ2_9CAUD|nr:hypothetical protein KNT81_gp213 [Proteus phage phiP4-3]AUM58558.1 hypothetical protein phiP43_200 [Proteus phage phiP4-3]